MIVCRMITLLQGEWEWGGFDLASPAVNEEEEEEAEDEADGDESDEEEVEEATFSTK